MPAYYRATVNEFLAASEGEVVSALVGGYAQDRFFQLLTTAAQSWRDSIPPIRSALADVLKEEPSASEWGLLLEYPLYRLRKRVDLVLLIRGAVLVVELKVGANRVERADLRQAEEYALDLRDFHRASHDLSIQAVLCCTELRNPTVVPKFVGPAPNVLVASSRTLADVVLGVAHCSVGGGDRQLDVREWDQSSYEPVPTIIEAATSIFAGHKVADISKHEAANLSVCSEAVLSLIEEAKACGRKRLIVLTGVPGAGKTLAGLNVTHGGEGGDTARGDVVYLSGNTPLVLVIREALAQDEKSRAASRGERKSLASIRHDLQTRIQHINDFLQEYMRHDMAYPPHEHAIVFDEAQRAWDHRHGLEKFGRDASEPELLMEIMGRHRSWAAIVCLVGAGQEINKGEAGMREWGDAIARKPEWEVVAPECALLGTRETAGTALFPDGVPAHVSTTTNEHLRLAVSMRSYRTEAVSAWVDAVLSGEPDSAAELAERLSNYPITLSRSLPEAKAWLHEQTRGCRRTGLLASTSAVRLLAEGLGATLTVQDKMKICHWYLQPPDDYRASNSLEVTANEYTCQGLELDYAGICWGGDFMRSRDNDDWAFRKLRGTVWNRVQNEDVRRFILNKYRVFLTRAREGMVLFVPPGDLADNTRPPELYDHLAKYLVECGARAL